MVLTIASQAIYAGSACSSTANVVQPIRQRAPVPVNASITVNVNASINVAPAQNYNVMRIANIQQVTETHLNPHGSSQSETIEQADKKRSFEDQEQHTKKELAAIERFVAILEDWKKKDLAQEHKEELKYLLSQMSSETAEVYKYIYMSTAMEIETRKRHSKKVRFHEQATMSSQSKTQRKSLKPSYKRHGNKR